MIPDLEADRITKWLATLPQQYDLAHDRIAAMRRDLRYKLLHELTGEFAPFLFGNATIEQRASLPPRQWLPTPDHSDHSHHGRPCARKLGRGEPTHRCLTCGLDDTCVLCKYCFNPADHEGHNVFVKISSRDDGGICDCGDAEAWKREIHCLADHGPEETAPLPEAFQERLKVVLGVMLDFCVNVLSCASLATQYATSEEFIKYLSYMSEISGVDPSGQQLTKKWCLMVWDDDKRSLNDLVASIKLATERRDDFLQMVVKRIHRTGRSTIVISPVLSDLMAIRSKIRYFATSIRAVGEVMHEEMVDEIIQLCLELTQCRVNGADPASITHIVGESLLGIWQSGISSRMPDEVMVELPEQNPEIWALSELVHSRVPTEDDEDLAYSQAHMIEHPDEYLSDDDDMIGGHDPDRDADTAFHQHHHHHHHHHHPNGPHNHEDHELVLSADEEEFFGPNHLFRHLAADVAEHIAPLITRDAKLRSTREQMFARVRYLIFYDVRMYKSLRQMMTDLYVAALVSNPDLKMVLAGIYADAYPMIVRQYAYIDREPDLSVTAALSTQLFTTPSIATELMQTNAFEAYIRMLRKLFTNRPGDLNVAAFRNRRLGQIFHEIGYLLWRNTKKEAVGADSSRLAQTANFLALFQGLAPMQRQLDKHVEYENERWVYCYATMPFALQLGRSVAIGIQDSSEIPVDAIKSIADSLALWQREAEASLASSAYEAFDISYGPFQELHRILSGINPARDPVSLLHPVHSFLSWLIEYAKFPDVNSLRIALGVLNPGAVALFDASMCTLAVLAQISVGLWIRNGYAARVQLSCYRDGSLRDLAYARDVLMTQISLCVLDPNTSFLNLAHRFGVAKWPKFDEGDVQQGFYMLDEFLHTLTFLFCDRLRLQGLPANEIRRELLAREIIQTLGFGMMPYSELTKMIMEMSANELFDMVLADVSDFTPPRGPQGVGMYTLKPELFTQFDPQYAYFSISRTEEADRVVESRVKDHVHLPPLLPLKGPWTRLRSFTRSAAFAEFVAAIVKHLLSVESTQPEHSTQAEQTLGRVLHLLLMAAKDDLSGSHERVKGCFNTVAEMMLTKPNLPGAFSSNGDNLSLVERLLTMLDRPTLQPMHKRVKTLFVMLHEKDPKVPLPTGPTTSENTVSEEQVKRKEKGRAMQMKALAEFKLQQEAFLQQNQGNVEGEDEDNFGADGDEDTTNGYTFPKLCVLCRMPDDEEAIYGILTYTTHVKTLRDLPSDDPYWVKQAYSEDPSLDVEHPLSTPAEHDHHGNRCVWGPEFPQENTRESTVSQGCGHGVHYKCFQEFMSQSQRSWSATRFTAENHAKGEFLCPLCEALSNGFMPVLWTVNDLSAETFLAEPTDPLLDMREAFSGNTKTRNLGALVESGLSTLSPKFLYAIEHRDFSEPFPSNVRTVLLEQMLRIKKASTTFDDAVYGLRTIYVSLASTVAQAEVALRGQAHTTPFGGLVLDQLPSRTVQFLRVYAKYINTLTGFIMSSFMQMNAEPEQATLLPLDITQALPSLVEMFMFRSPVYGLAPRTVMKTAIVVIIIRTLVSVSNINVSELPTGRLPLVSPEVSAEISRWTEKNPQMVYAILRYQLTVALRRIALLTFALCGKYDPDDFAGIMDLPEHDRLMAYLGLPPLATFIENMGRETPEGFAAQRIAMERHVSLGIIPRIEYPGVYRLLKLPQRLDSMFNVPDHPLPSDPAICLFCGHMCGIQSGDFEYRDVGPCNAHIPTCGVSQGIFLLPRRNFLLLLLPEGRGTFVPAPYLDLHGEVDENMRRGRPHYLQPIRYDTFAREMWLANGLPSFIARRLDQNQDPGGWETL